MKYVFGVDIGGTTVKIGLFDVEGNVLDKWEIPTRTENDGEEILPDVADSIREKMKQMDKDAIAGVGVGAPGPIDAGGVVHRAVNLGWKTFNVKETLEALINLPVRSRQ